MDFPVRGQKNLTGKCYVYRLIDPRSGAPFYVGISKNPWSRFDGHRNDPGSGGWPKVRELLKAGFARADILHIHTWCENREAAYKLEHQLITTTEGLLNRNRTRQHHYVWDRERGYVSSGALA
jgi:hypothetical protein